jgi:hypothetical protein
MDAALDQLKNNGSPINEEDEIRLSALRGADRSNAVGLLDYTGLIFLVIEQFRIKNLHFYQLI